MTFRRLLLSGLLSAGLVCLTISIYAVLAADTRTEVVWVENPTIVVNDMPAKQKRQIVFLIHNDGREDLEVVGCQWLCTKEACFGPRPNDRIPLPAGRTVEMPLEVVAYEPGPFSIACPLYLRDRCGLREVNLCASGTAVGAVAAAPATEAAQRP